MKEFLLVSVKSKTSQTSNVYVIEKSSIGDFIASYLTPDTVVLVDSVDLPDLLKKNCKKSVD